MGVVGTSIPGHVEPGASTLSVSVDVCTTHRPFRARTARRGSPHLEIVESSSFSDFEAKSQDYHFRKLCFRFI
jgi:hypothetical protein